MATDGRWWHPAVPHDDCLKPQAAVGAALDALELAVVAETRVRQDVTPAQQALADEARALGCSPVVKDMIALSDLDGGDVTGAGPTAALEPPLGPTVLCRYRVGTDPRDPSALGFVSGERVAPASAAALWDAVAAGGPVRACSAPHTASTVLAAGGDAVAQIETDGCHRVLVGYSRWSQAAPALLAALDR